MNFDSTIAHLFKNTLVRQVLGEKSTFFDGDIKINNGHFEFDRAQQFHKLSHLSISHIWHGSRDITHGKVSNQIMAILNLIRLKFFFSRIKYLGCLEIKYSK